MGKQEIDTEKMIVSIYNDQQRLVKHFGLDRFSKNDTKDDEASNKLLESIASKLEILSTQKSFTGEQQAMLNKMMGAINETLTNFQTEQRGELLSLLEEMRGLLGRLHGRSESSVIKHHHTHMVALKSSKTVLVMVAMGLAILASLFFNFRQAEKNNALMDNDLKYRYIKMQGSATQEEVVELEYIFVSHRNEETIKKICQQVEEYERLVTEQAQRIEQARLNADRAERLRREAEAVKEKK